MIRSEMDYHAVRVAPQKERRCVNILEQRGIAALYPRRAFARRRHRNSKRVVMIEKPALPGYVFICFERGVPMCERPWRAVLDLHIVYKLLNLGGVPLTFPHDDLKRLFTPQEFYREEAERRRRGLVVGSAIKITAGPFGGFEGKVTAMTDDELRTAVMIMGRSCPLVLSYDQVSKVA